METLGRYQITGELGRGGCGVVYSALDNRIGRKVAIKTIIAGEEPGAHEALADRLRREAHSAGVLSHPNIVTVYELGEEGNMSYIVMEFVNGTTLKDRMETGEPIPMDVTLNVLRQTAAALDFAHSQRIIHRDVKPANILLTGSGMVKMADFGIAKILTDSSLGKTLTQVGMVMGTAYYMAPEQIMGKPIDGRADQFALGIIAYEVLTGRRPFEGNTWPTLVHQVLYAEPSPLEEHRPELPPALTAVIRKALAKEPQNRYKTCTDFVSDLNSALDRSDTIMASMAATIERPVGETASGVPLSGLRSLFSGGRWLTAALVVVSIALVGSLALLYRSFLRDKDDKVAASDASQTNPPAMIRADPGSRKPGASPPAPVAKPERAKIERSTELPVPKPPASGPASRPAPETSAPETSASETKPAQALPDLPEPEPPRYRGPPEGSFAWFGSLPRSGTLAIAANHVTSGTLSGRGLPPRVTATAEVSPASVRIVEQPSAANRYRLVLQNSGEDEIRDITIYWKETRN